MALKTLRWVFVLLAALCIADGPASAQQLPKMVHAGLRTLYLAPVFIGIDRGIFKANGVEVTYSDRLGPRLTVQAKLEAMASIGTGNVQVAISGSPNHTYTITFRSGS